jgi:hypothetical protein
MVCQTSRVGRRLVAVWMAAVVVTLAAVGVGGAGAQPEASNLELMSSITEDVVRDLVASIEEARAGRGLRLVPYANTEEYRFIENVFTTVLNERGVEIYRPLGSQGQAGAPRDVLSLEFQATVFSVVYPKIFRSYLIGGKQVRRKADVAVVVTLVDPSSGAVLTVEQASREVSDTFSHGNLSQMEEGTFQFVRPAMPPSGWGRVVEPVFVSGIIVGLIYLFFSNQSDE